MLHIEEQAQERIASLLHPLDLPTLRSRHDQFSVSLRKNDRNERAAKRRLASSSTTPGGLETTNSVPARLIEIWKCIEAKEVPALDQIEIVFVWLKQAGNVKEQLECLKVLSALSALDLKDRAEGLERMGLIEAMISLIYGDGGDAEVRKQALWILCNLTSSMLTEAVVIRGGLDVFWRGLDCTDMALLELSIWGLGNIAGDGVSYRDRLIMAGLTERILDLMSSVPYNQYRIINVCVSCLGNLMRGEPKVSMTICAKIVPVLAVMLESEDGGVVVEALWALFFLCGEEEEPRIQVILNTGRSPLLLNLLTSPKQAVSWPALKLAGKLLLGSENQIQTLLNLGVLNSLLVLMKRKVKTITKEVLWCLSNIASQNKHQVLHILRHDVIHEALACLTAESEEIRLEASWVFANAAVIGQYEACRNLFSLEVRDPMTTALKDPHPRIVRNMLDMCEALLETGERESELSGRDFNTLVTLFEQHGTVEVLMDLTQTKNLEISEKAGKILQRFFAFEGEDDYLSKNQV